MIDIEKEREELQKHIEEYKKNSSNILWMF